MANRTVAIVSDRAAKGATALRALKGRGAVSNPQGRFEKLRRASADDGWQPLVHQADSHDESINADNPTESVATVRREHSVGKAISYNRSPDIFFDRAINPYRGCEHGCIYCYARPGHAFEGLSPGLDFETKIIARTNLAGQLAAELDAPAYGRQPCLPITIGSFTDPYQPSERELRITRAAIEVLVQRRHPFAIVSRGVLIERDLDLLAAAAEQSLVACFVSVTTLDGALARKFEPRAPAPVRRLQTIARLAAKGIPVGVMTAPIVPFINDADLEKILEKAAANGARSAHYTVLRLPNEVKPIFQDWLALHFPQRYERVMNRIRDMRSGRENDPNFHSRMRGTGPWAELIANRFNRAVRRYGLTRQRPSLDTSRFRPAGGRHQMALF